MEFNKRKKLNNAELTALALEKASNGSVVHTSSKYQDSFFILRKNSVVRIKKEDLGSLFNYLKSGDKFALVPDDIAKLRDRPDQNIFLKGDLRIDLRLEDGLYKAKVKSTKKKSKLKVAVYVLGGTILVTAIIGGAVFLIGPAAVTAFALSKVLLVASLAKAHPFMTAQIALSVTGMLAYKYYQHRKKSQPNTHEPAQATSESAAASIPDLAPA